jgi:hypothetical protein
MSLLLAVDLVVMETPVVEGAVLAVIDRLYLVKILAEV